MEKLPSGTFNFKLGGIEFAPTYWTAIAIVVLLFLLILVLAQVRRHFIDWSAKGALFGLFFGFILALILEGFLIIGGKTAITELLGWKNAPKPLMVALDAGRQKLIGVLGVSDEIPSSLAAEEKPKDLLELIENLPPEEEKFLREFLCKPR